MKTLVYSVMLSLTGALILVGRPIRADEPHMHSAHMLKCAKICADCQIACDSCAGHCLAMLESGKKEHAATLKTCMDCAEACKLAATLCARGSNFAVFVCDSCAKCCEECGKACEKFPDDKHMAQCAKACKDCAKACKEMIEHLKA
jgi:hypothetical protein